MTPTQASGDVTDGPYPDVIEPEALFLLTKWQEALPSSMSDDWLRGIARDLRQNRLPYGDLSAMTRASALLQFILTIRGERRCSGELTIPSEDMWPVAIAYQTLVESELVTRTIGIRSAGDEREFLDFVDDAVRRIAARKHSAQLSTDATQGQVQPRPLVQRDPR